MDKYPEDLEKMISKGYDDMAWYGHTTGFTWTSPDGATITMKPEGVSVSICYKYKPKKIVKYYKMLIAKGDTGVYLNKDEK